MSNTQGSIGYEGCQEADISQWGFNGTENGTLTDFVDLKCPRQYELNSPLIRLIGFTTKDRYELNNPQNFHRLTEALGCIGCPFNPQLKSHP